MTTTFATLDSDAKTIVRHLMRTEGLNETEALNELDEMRERAAQGEDPEEILHDIGLEPDYVFALI